MKIEVRPSHPDQSRDFLEALGCNEFTKKVGSQTHEWFSVPERVAQMPLVLSIDGYRIETDIQWPLIETLDGWLVRNDDYGHRWFRDAKTGLLVGEKDVWGSSTHWMSFSAMMEHRPRTAAEVEQEKITKDRVELETLRATLRETKALLERFSETLREVRRINERGGPGSRKEVRGLIDSVF